MKCKLDQMSWEEIIKEFNTKITEEYIYCIFTEQVTDKIHDTFMELISSGKSQKEITNFMDENAQCFDKVKYIMLEHLLAEIRIEKNEREEQLIGELPEYKIVEILIDKQNYDKMTRSLIDAYTQGIDETIAIVNNENDKMILYIISTLESIKYASEEHKKIFNAKKEKRIRLYQRLKEERI